MAKKLFFRASIGLLSAAAASCLVPSSAYAASAQSPGSMGWSKSEAILGAPSALQALLSAQNAPGSLTPAVQPAAYSLPTLVPAVVRDEPAADEGAVSGRPDVFGSVALRVDHTPLDARWKRVENSGLSGNAAHYAETLKSLTPLERLQAINAYVNRRVHYVDDYKQFGREDVWSSADSTLRHGEGDCEDYAIAKLQLARRAGIAGHDLYLVIVRDLVRRADHAVLVARADGRMLLLDDGTDKVLNTSEVSDYRPVLTFASYGEWTHGYRMPKPTLTIASAQQAPVLASSDDQRSRSASLLAFNAGFRR